MSICEELPAPVLGDMLSSRSRTESHLDHPNSNLQRAALLLMCYHWSPTPDFRDICCRMMFADSDTTVRLTAMEVLIATCAFPDIEEQTAAIVGGSYQLAAGEAANTAAQFAHLVCDPLELEEIREMAYLSLFHVSGKPFSQRPGGLKRPMFRKLRIPEDIDWSFVRSYLK